MTSQASTQRPEPGRSATWPSAAAMQSTQNSVAPTENDAFRDDLEQHPERHFLSPVIAEECYGWDSDSDDEDDGGEWSAGIMDFSLFTADRKRAMETGEPLDEKWDSFVLNQAEAFERSCDRVRESEEERVPELTPDTSPNLRDDMEADVVEDGKMVVPWIKVPDYLTREVKPSGSGKMVGPDDELPLSFALLKKRIQRPGLRHARTMSGRKHVWRRPGDDMFTVGEDLEAETVAEREDGEMRRVASMETLELRAE